MLESLRIDHSLGVVATLLNLWGWCSYLTKLCRDKPNTSWESWLYSLLTLGFAAFSHLKLSHSLPNSMPYLVGLLAVLATTGIAAIQNPLPLNWSKLAIWVTIATISSIALPASLINLGVCILYLFTYSGFVQNLQKGGSEPAKPWWLWTISSLFVLATTHFNENATLWAYLLPTTNLLCYILVLSNLQNKKT